MKRTIYITVKRKHELEETRVIQVRQKIVITVKTSMMWPSQKFLLYIRNIIKMKGTEMHK